MRLRFTLVLLLLAGCAGKQMVPLHNRPVIDIRASYAFNGRVAAIHEGERSSAGIRWNHRGEEDEVLLLAPLGKTVARIYSNGQAVSLQAGDRFHVAKDAESLTEQVLGWHLPLTGMRYWMLAMPASGSEAEMQRDDRGQLVTMRQDGWQIQYQRYASDAPDSLPLRMLMTREGMELKLLIDEWESQ